MRPWAVGGLMVVSIVVILGIFVPLFSPYGTTAQVAEKLLTPTLVHPFGTDQLGRDVFTRTFAAVQLDLFMALIGVAVPFLLGTAIGGVAGALANRLVDGAIVLLIQSINAFPFLVLAIAVLAAVGGGIVGVVVAIWLTNWARYARIARARARAVRYSGFAQATRVLGYSRARVLVRHIFPNVYEETLAYALSDFVIVILLVAGLSYLGLGVRPPTPEWGAMMADGQLYLRSNWWLSVSPGAVLAATSVGVSLFARDYADRRSGR